MRTQKTRSTHGSCHFGKARYRTENDAKQMLRTLREKKTATHKVPVRAYHCNRCKGWHLTSEE